MTSHEQSQPVLALPKVSVVVTAHNYGRFLVQCLDSVLDQTCPDLELIVVNDGSTDDSAAVLARYASDPLVTVHTLSGVGLAAAANYGIRRARGAYILRLDADDYLDRHAVALQASFLDQHSDVGLVYPDHFTVSEQGAFLGYTRALTFSQRERGVGRLPLPGGSMYRKRWFDVVGGYDETLRYQEDYDFWLRVTAHCQVASLHLPLLYYRQHAGSMSRNVASRAAARRHVKRTHAADLRAKSKAAALVVIPDQWPGEPTRSRDRLRAPLGDSTLLDQTLRLVSSEVREGRVLIVSDSSAVERACAALGLRRMSWPDGDAAVPGWPPALQALRRIVEEARGLPPWDVAVLLSPYCPFRHAERVEEALDTLALHQCDLVLSIEADPVQAWAEGPEGLSRLCVDAAGAGGGRIVREAGELLVATREALLEGRPLAACRTGYVEVLAPEAWTVKDEVSANLCAGLLAAGIAAQLKPGQFLMTKEGG